MTYCCGILVRDGLVMIADTRTNAGLDNISVFRKLQVYSNPGERIMAIAASGNLSLTQSVVSTVNEGWENPESGERETLTNAPTMFKAAQRIGRAIRTLHDIEGEALDQSEVKFDLAFLFGGQIKGEALRLFMINNTAFAAPPGCSWPATHRACTCCFCSRWPCSRSRR